MSSARSDLLEVAMADPRYAVEAYEFLCQALAFTQQSMGKPREKKDLEAGDDGVNHVTGQELCDGIRRFALEQFGLMTPVVFSCWGIKETADFGKMVYHLIESGLWHKSDNDSIDDFSEQFDIGTAFQDHEIDWKGGD